MSYCLPTPGSWESSWEIQDFNSLYDWMIAKRTISCPTSADSSLNINRELWTYSEIYLHLLSAFCFNICTVMHVIISQNWEGNSRSMSQSYKELTGKCFFISGTLLCRLSILVPVTECFMTLRLFVFFTGSFSILPGLCKGKFFSARDPQMNTLIWAVAKSGKCWLLLRQKARLFLWFY